MCTQSAAIPPTSPPRAIRLVMFELAGKEDGNQDLVNGPLDENNRDETEYRMRGVP